MQVSHMLLVYFAPVLNVKLRREAWVRRRGGGGAGWVGLYNEVITVSCIRRRYNLYLSTKQFISNYIN